jgi:hypothetical protein
VSTQLEKPDPILIRLEVSIPTGVATPQIVSSVQPAAPSTPPSAPGVLHSAALRSTAPRATRPQILTSAISNIEVVCVYPGTSLCRVRATGSCINDPFLGPPVQVHGQLVAQSAPQPGLSIPYGCPGTAPVAGGWELFFDVDCSGTYQLHIWHKYSDDSSVKEEASFTPSCYGKPDCAAAEVALNRSTIPEAIAFGWKVEAAGFSGKAVGPLQGMWELYISDFSKSGVVISNRPKTACCPLVRMTGDSNFANWKLNFNHRGVSIEYGLSGRAFQPAGVNVFTICGASGAGVEDSLPASLTVRPI